jgi:hypothetical protein
MPPSTTRTWQYLINKKRNDLTNGNDIQPDKDSNFPNYDKDQPQFPPDLLDSLNLGTTPQPVYDL